MSGCMMLCMCMARSPSLVAPPDTAQQGMSTGMVRQLVQQVQWQAWSDATDNRAPGWSLHSSMTGKTSCPLPEPQTLSVCMQAGYAVSLHGSLHWSARAAPASVPPDDMRHCRGACTAAGGEEEGC